MLTLTESSVRNMETAREHEQPGADESIGGALARNPAVQTLIMMLGVSAFSWAGFSIGIARLFVLAPPVFDPWWSIPVSVYAHSSVGHFIGNATTLILAGGLVSLSTTAVRFHLFFLVTGAVAAISHVWVNLVMGDVTAVIGASGATFALVGYILVANPVADILRGVLSSRIVAVVAGILAIALTFRYSAPGSALIGHFTGALLGMVAGRFHLLRVSDQ